MAGGGGGVPVYKKDIVHNLGYKPIVRAYTYMSAYSVWGLREVPINYYIREWVDGIGWAILETSIYYVHIDDNTIRFYGGQDAQIKVTLYLEPRKDAWDE